jgi:small subunit ribosomal protein S5
LSKVLKKKIDPNELDLKDKVVETKIVQKVTKGGRIRSFAALVVVGDGNGHVGIGLGKATETQEAIRKGKEDAKKNLVYIERNQDDSIFHEILGRFGACSVLLKPAGEGTGVIAGGAVRDVLEMAGVRNIVSKSIGSSNKRNVVNATLEGLTSLKTPEKVAALRGRKIEDVS